MTARSSEENEQEERRSRSVTIGITGFVILFALAILLWQVWKQSQAVKPGAVPVSAGPLAGEAPNQEEHKMLRSLNDHPELARQRIPQGGGESNIAPPAGHVAPN